LDERDDQLTAKQT